MNFNIDDKNTITVQVIDYGVWIFFIQTATPVTPVSIPVPISSFGRGAYLSDLLKALPTSTAATTVTLPSTTVSTPVGMPATTATAAHSSHSSQQGMCVRV